MKWIALLLAFCCAWVQAALPTPVSEIDLGNDLSGAQEISSSAPVVVVCIGSPCVLTVIDISNPNKPNIRGSLTLEAVPTSLSLSGDGRFLVTLLDQQKQEYNKETPRVAIGIDLSELDKPKVSWRHEFVAAAAMVMPQASGFLATVSEPAQKPGHSPTWKTLLFQISMSGVERGIAIASTDYSPPNFAVSKNARFLASTLFGSKITAYDLSKKPPTTYEQEGFGFSRFRNIYGILNSGSILVSDNRRPGIGVYASRIDIPRVAFLSLAVDDYDGRMLPSQANGTVYISHSLTGAIQQIDFSDPNHPKEVERWSLPPSTTPIAITSNGNLYATTGTLLKAFRLDKATAPKQSWNEFEITHTQAMKAYTTSERPEFLRELDALRVFYQGTFGEALDTPVSGIPPKRAAMMLNDYGFLAGRGSTVRSSHSEKALRRAIALDPTRAVAYMNLADTLRTGLQSLPIEKRTRSAAEIESLYRKYLLLGGQAKQRISRYLQTNPSKQTEKDSCKGIATFANAGVLKDIFIGGDDIKIDNRRIQIAATTQGTAHVPVIFAWDLATDYELKDLPLPADTEQLWGGDNLGVIAYRDDVHILHYRDMRHPVASTSLSTGKGCKFLSSTQEIVQPESFEPELCRRIVKEVRPPAVEFKTPAWIVDDLVREIYSETHAGSMATLDFTNDGKASVVVGLGLASGAGAGCDAEFFDLLDASGNRFLVDERRKLLHQLQDLDPSDRYPIRPCGNEPRFFRHKGNIYFESRSKSWPPSDERDQYHLVRRVKDGKVVDACRFGFQTSVSVE